MGLGISLGPLTQIQFFSVQSDTEDKKQTDKQWMDMQQREGPGQRSGNQRETQRQQQRHEGWEPETEVDGKSESQNRRETGRGRGESRNMCVNFIRSEGSRANVSWVLLTVRMI